MLIKGKTYGARLLEIKDGDSFELEINIEGKRELARVRLYGIDAPEHAQPLGNKAAGLLAKLMYGHSQWTLLVKDKDHYRRTVGLVYPSDSSADDSVNRHMALNGMAYWDPRYDRRNEYGIGEAELTARTQRRGVWKDSPRDGDVRPWFHRKEQDGDDFFAEIERQDLQSLMEKNVDLQRQIEDSHLKLQHRSDEANKLQRQLRDAETRLLQERQEGERQRDALERQLDEIRHGLRRERERTDSLRRKNAHLQRQLDRRPLARLSRLLSRLG